MEVILLLMEKSGYRVSRSASLQVCLASSGLYRPVARWRMISPLCRTQT